MANSVEENSDGWRTNVTESDTQALALAHQAINRVGNLLKGPSPAESKMAKIEQKWKEHYERKLMAMLNDGRIDTGELDSLAQQVIVDILREQIERITFELGRIVRFPAMEPK